MGVRRAALRQGDAHAGSLTPAPARPVSSQAQRFSEMLQAGEAELAQVLGVAWWRDWTWRRCIRRSGDATAADSGLIALVLQGAITLDELDEIGAVVSAVTDDANLWLRCEREGHLGDR